MTRGAHAIDVEIETAEAAPDRINQFRTQRACLPPYARWPDGEACADQLAQYDSTMPMMPHAGARAKICAPASWPRS